MTASMITALLCAVLSISVASAFSVQTTNTRSPSENPTVAVPENPLSQELLLLLQQKYKKGPTQTSSDRIDELVRSLIKSKCSFAPAEAIDGPLFATIHFIGKTPLWEKIGLGNQKNLKGQQYTISKTGEKNTVVNYSEILGNAVHLQAVGSFVDAGPSKIDSDTAPTDSKPQNNNNNNLLQNLQSLFPVAEKKEEGLKTCPYDYDVTIEGASLEVFGNSFKIPITGLGTARVLYADPCLRIFVSPTGSEVKTGGGDWETAGLVTVQVRIDLIDPSWNVRL